MTMSESGVPASDLPDHGTIAVTTSLSQQRRPARRPLITIAALRGQGLWSKTDADLIPQILLKFKFGPTQAHHYGFLWYLQFLIDRTLGGNSLLWAVGRWARNAFRTRSA